MLVICKSVYNAFTLTSSKAQPSSLLMSSSTDTAAFRVIGIALVVDQLGKGPRMVLRYPTRDHQYPKRYARTTDRSKQPLHIKNNTINSSINSNSNNRSSDTGGNNTKSLKGSISKKNNDTITTTPTSHNNHHNPSTSDHDLFFTLSGRQMSKLFRPKPSLCGQPITLTIDQTYFCCCAVLMNQNATNSINTGGSSSSGTTGSTENSNTGTNDGMNSGMKVASMDASTSTTNSPAGKDQPLVLFSLVVAVAPTTTTTPPHSLPPGMNAPTMTKPNEMGHTRSSYSHDNPIFPCIRRVHIALARICRVLEREERRCHYVSSQVLSYEQIRSELTSSSSSKSRLVDTSSKTPASSLTSNSSIPPKDTTPSEATNATPFTSTVTTTFTASTDASNSGPTLSTIVHAPSSTVTKHRRSGSSNASSVPDISPLMMPPPSTVPSELVHPDLSSSSLSSSVLPHASQPPAFSSIKTTTFQQPQWELEQIILETFMTAPRTRYVRTTSQPDDDDPVEMEHAGNLAQELAQVYHALAATHCGTTADPSHMMPTTRPPNGPTQSSLLLSGRDSVVYINGHMAVTIEAATAIVSAPLLQCQPEFNVTALDDTIGVSTNRTPIIRPYMTLLFPTHTADQILDSLHMPLHGDRAETNQIVPQPRRIQQFLKAWSPQKSLLDMAEETYLPLEVTLDVAKQLVRQGLCIVSPVLFYSVGFVCPNVQRLQQMTLPFYQRFGIHIHLFALVSYLTASNRTFGMCLSQLIRYPNNFENNSTNDPINTLVRIPIVTSILRQASSTSSIYDKNANDDGTASHLLRSNENIHHAALEDIVYQMIIWLCSHQVIAPLQEYLVLVRPNPNLMVGPVRSSGEERPRDRTATDERKHDEMMKASSVSTRSGSGTTTSNNNDTNNGNERNDDWIRQSILNHCFNHSNENHDMDVPRPDRPSPPEAAQHQVLLLECCHRTGIEERILRSFVARSAHQFRIRMAM